MDTAPQSGNSSYEGWRVKPPDHGSRDLSFQILSPHQSNVSDTNFINSSTTMLLPLHPPPHPYIAFTSSFCPVFPMSIFLIRKLTFSTQMGSLGAYLTPNQRQAPKLSVLSNWDEDVSTRVSSGPKVCADGTTEAERGTFTS